MRVALDAMGGDHAPVEVVRGAVDGLSFLGSGDELVLIGDPKAINAELARLNGWEGRVQIVPASQVIGANEEPVEALRQKRDSSIVKMVTLVADGHADAVISAGNTGACAAACQLKLRTIPGVSRAGIAVVVPSFGGPIVMCDVGANVAPKPHQLYQYALMCAVYAEQILGKKSPKVGLLSVGEEDIKGSPLVRRTRELIKSDPFLNFVGNVESRDIVFGTNCDVVVCDGFVGNIALKLMEGLVEGWVMHFGKELAEAMPDLMSKAEPILRQIHAKHDYSEHGGARLLGVEGVVIICHGRSDRRAFRSAVRVAVEAVRANVNEVIASQLAKGVGVVGEG